MIHKWAIAAAVTGVTVVGTLAAPAQAITLGEIGNGFLDVGDKRFSNFQCALSTSDMALLVPNSCDEIKINTIENSPFGIDIQGPFSVTNFASPDTEFLETLISFDVEALDPTKAIDSINLAFNGAFAGNGKASVKETARVDGTIVAELMVSNPYEGGSDLQDPALEGEDFDLATPYKKLNITKEIRVEAEAGGSAEISSIVQTYDQTEVPEPGTIGGLLAVGSLGVGSILKQLKQKK
ncbi:PEP-CTERM sorting domain-containing protein [Coleofasciculus chthonoplastes]|uniref:PEP-CTERM sorting domain-containing protein n=1 Tax=Coleofasciculus chthonoplastes TaxID=64178 RepID=UPI0032F11801